MLNRRDSTECREPFLKMSEFVLFKTSPAKETFLTNKKFKESYVFLDDKTLPAVPYLVVRLPVDYPNSSPRFDTKDYGML